MSAAMTLMYEKLTAEHTTRSRCKLWYGDRHVCIRRILKNWVNPGVSLSDSQFNTGSCRNVSLRRAWDNTKNGLLHLVDNPLR